tara:strand:+ start:1186 stop:1608 length:423 start_codon:yes stop_codon:yes gene_type:complete
MVNDTVELVIYKYSWNTRYCGFASSKSAAIEGVNKHYLYGEPEENEDETVLGTQWAETQDEEGWRVEPLTIHAVKIPGELKGSFVRKETVHLIWQCLECNQYFSDDAKEDIISPVLVTCSCRKNEKFYLVEFECGGNGDL